MARSHSYVWVEALALEIFTLETPRAWPSEKLMVLKQTDTHLIYVVEPKLAGCERLRYIVKKDGSQVVTQTAIGDKWSKGGVSMRSD